MVLLEEVQGQRAMNADFKEPFIEGQRQYRGVSVPCYDCKTPFLGIPEQLSGTMSEIACTEETG